MWRKMLYLVLSILFASSMFLACEKKSTDSSVDQSANASPRAITQFAPSSGKVGDALRFVFDAKNAEFIAVSFDGGIFMLPESYISETGQEAVIFFENNAETMILSTTYAGNAADFGWIIPAPSRPAVEKYSKEIYAKLADFTRPQRAESYSPFLSGSRSTSEEVGSQGVTVLEEKQVGIYDVSVLEASDINALYKWLQERKYQVLEKTKPVLNEYIQANWYFVAARINSPSQGTQDSSGLLEPLKISFSNDKIIYPLKITKATSQASDDQPAAVPILLYVFTDKKMAAENYATEYAGPVTAEQIKKLFTDGGTPIKSVHSFYLTKFFSQQNIDNINNDLTFSVAKDQSDINAPPSAAKKLLSVVTNLLGYLFIWLFLAALYIVPLFIIAFITKKAKKLKVKQIGLWIVILCFAAVTIYLIVAEVKLFLESYRYLQSFAFDNLIILPPYALILWFSLKTIKKQQAAIKAYKDIL